MRDAVLNIYVADRDGRPTAVALTRADLEKLFEQWLVKWGSGSPHYAAEMKDTKKYGTDSAEQFLDLAVEIGKENFKREWATDGQP